MSLTLVCAACEPKAPAGKHGDLYANADTCEASHRQLAIDRSNSGSKAALWRVATHYNLCDINETEAKVWLRKLADMNDPKAMVILGAWAEADGNHLEAVEWNGRASRLGYDTHTEAKNGLRQADR